MKTLKKIAGLTTTLFLGLTLTSCFDLGDEDEGEYTSMWEVTTISSDGSTDTKSMSEYYNDSAINDFTCPYEDADEFQYMACKCTKNIDVGEVAFYITSEKNVILDYNIYVVTDLPTDFGEESDIISVIDDYIADNTKEVNFDSITDAPPKSEAIASGSVSLKKDEFDSVEATEYTTDNSGEKKSKFTLSTNDYILIQFQNNTLANLDSEGITTEEQGHALYDERVASKAKINFTALLIQHAK